jgi:hypothetical protein
VTHAIAKMTRPWASRKLRSLGTWASTRASAPANQAHRSPRVLPDTLDPPPFIAPL